MYALVWEGSWSTSPFCWCPQRRCCPRYLKIQGQNRRRHCSLKTKSNLETEKCGGINLIAMGDWEQNTKTGKDFSHASSLSSSLGRVFREDLVPDWRRRLFAHPFLFLPPGRKTKHRRKDRTTQQKACKTCKSRANFLSSDSQEKKFKWFYSKFLLWEAHVLHIQENKLNFDILKTFTSMTECMNFIWTYMRPRALRASLCCNLRFSSVSLRTWSSAAQRSQLHKNTHLKIKYTHVFMVWQQCFRTSSLYRLLNARFCNNKHYSECNTVRWVDDLNSSVQWKQANKYYLLFQPLKWIRYFGILLPCSSAPIKTSMTCNVNTQ